MILANIKFIHQKAEEEPSSAFCIKVVIPSDPNKP